MITGRWAFAGQVSSTLGEPDDRIPFSRLTYCCANRGWIRRRPPVAMFQMMGVFAEFERAMIAKRVVREEFRRH
jgi:hypothetical protein